MMTKRGIGILGVIDIMSKSLGLSVARLSFVAQDQSQEVLCFTNKDGSQVSILAGETDVSMFPEFTGNWDVMSLGKDVGDFLKEEPSLDDKDNGKEVPEEKKDASVPVSTVKGASDEAITKARDVPNESGAGYCICQECGYEEVHKRGVPCMDRKCPDCGASLIPRDVAKDFKDKGFLQRMVDFGSQLLGKSSPVEEPLESSPMFFTIKDVETDRRRWVGITSTAFVDKEGEIVSQKALEQAANVDPALLGELRFWHQKGMVLGNCDFRAVHGLCLVESGLWRDDGIGRAAEKGIQDTPDNWGLSLAFLFNPTTLEKGVRVKNARVRTVYNDIMTVERSVLPQLWAANWFSTIRVKSDDTDEESIMQKKQMATLEALVGPEQAKALIAEADKINQKGLSTSAVFKDTDDVPTKLAAIATKMTEEDSASAEVLLAAAKLLQPKDETPTPKVDDNAVKEMLIGFIQELPECETKAALTEALGESATTEDPKTKSTPTPDVPKTEDPVTPDNAVLAALKALDGKLTVVDQLQKDVKALQDQTTVRNVFAPGTMPSGSTENVVKDADPIAPDDENEEGNPILKQMADHMSSTLFEQTPGGNQNG